MDTKCAAHAAEIGNLLACCPPQAFAASGVGAGEGGIRAKLLEAKAAFDAGEYWRGAALAKEAFDLAWAAWIGQASAPVFSASAAPAGGFLADLLKQFAPLLLKLLLGL